MIGNDNWGGSMNAPRLTCAFVLLATSLAWTQPHQYPFQNPSLPVEVRIDNILSLMTLEEKISALSTSPDVPRLGIHGSGHIEGLHGVALGGPGGWGGAASSRCRPRSFRSP
jgi:beta-glucosidase